MKRLASFVPVLPRGHGRRRGSGYPLSGQKGRPMRHTSELHKLLEQVRCGDPDACNRVIEHACDRLRKLTRKMLKGYPQVRRWAETDDVLQNALLRLHRSIAELRPESCRQFYGLAAVQIRRELLDFAKHFQGAHGIAAKHHSDGGRAAERKAADPLEPETLEAWAHFHEQVDRSCRRLTPLTPGAAWSRPGTRTAVSPSFAGTGGGRTRGPRPPPPAAPRWQGR